MGQKYAIYNKNDFIGISKFAQSADPNNFTDKNWANPINFVIL